MKTLRAALSLLAGTAALLLGGAQAEAATSLSSVSNSCWTTEQPFTLVENEFAKLTWDVYGNLTLINHSGKGSKLVWGLNSSEPLTGSNAGKLCFGNGAGRLRIHKSTGEGVWTSGLEPGPPPTYSYAAQNGVLHLTECAIQIKNTSGVVQWEEQTGQCETSKRATPSVNKCWSKDDTKTLLTNEETGQELRWQNGKVLFRDTKGEMTTVFHGVGTNLVASKEICHETDGRLVVRDMNGAEIWSLAARPRSPAP
jgi:hypothetical protein